MSLAGLLKKSESTGNHRERERENQRQLKRHRVLKFSLQLLLEDDWTCSNVERGYAHTVGDVTSFSQRKHTVFVRLCHERSDRWRSNFGGSCQSRSPGLFQKSNFGSNSLNSLVICWFIWFRWAPVWWFLSRIVKGNPQGALVHLQRAHAHWKQRERRGASNEEATDGHGRIRKKQDESKLKPIRFYFHIDFNTFRFIYIHIVDSYSIFASYFAKCIQMSLLNRSQIQGYCRPCLGLQRFGQEEENHVASIRCGCLKSMQKSGATHWLWWPVPPWRSFLLGVSENRASTPLYPMVLLIIIPMKNGYVIGNINPTFSDKPFQRLPFWLVVLIHGMVLCSSTQFSAQFEHGAMQKAWSQHFANLPCLHMVYYPYIYIYYILYHIIWNLQTLPCLLLLQDPSGTFTKYVAGQNMTEFV